MNEAARTLAVVILLAAAVWAWRSDYSPSPAPTPDDARLILRGLFVGETAAEDASVLAAFSAELADEIEWDGEQPEPMLKSGVQFDTLRVRARELRCRGQSIGDRQPRVRDAIHQFLDDAVGTSGGPVDRNQRAKWVDAYRVIAGAAANATR
jgi:hypothetical protein